MKLLEATQIISTKNLTSSLPELPHLPHREVIAGNYRVVYRYESNNNEVKIITVVHGSRLLTETFLTE